MSMDANGDCPGGAVARLRADGVLIDNYPNMEEAEQKRVLMAIAADYPRVKKLLNEMKNAFLTLGRKYEKLEEELGCKYREVEEELEKVCEQQFLKKEREVGEESDSSSSSTSKRLLEFRERESRRLIVSKLNVYLLCPGCTQQAYSTNFFLIY